MNTYLARVSLDGQVSHVLGRTGYTPAAEDLIERALAALDADPAACAVVTRTAAILESASAHKIATIAYMPAPSSQSAPSSHATASINGLANLVIRVRSRPLPN